MNTATRFGKQMEYYIISKMLEEGLDVYIPVVDDMAIDAVVRRKDGSFVEVQIKARSEEVKLGNATLFAAITHEPRNNYYFVFYSHRLKKMWILSSEEFIKEAAQGKTGEHKGTYTICFNGKSAKNKTEHALSRYDNYLRDLTFLDSKSER